MRGDTLQTALSVSPEPEGRLLFVHAEAPAENERSPAVGHRNVSAGVMLVAGQLIIEKRSARLPAAPAALTARLPGDKPFANLPQ
jgi:hypothetical protein